MRFILADTPGLAEQVLRRARDEKVALGWDTETSGPDLKRHSPVLSHRIVCFSLSGVTESDGPWKACVDGEYLQMFRGILEDQTIPKYDANTKFEIHVAANHHINYRGSVIDCNLASATLDAHERAHSVEAAGLRNLGTSKRKFKEVVPDMDTERAWIMDREDFALYSADDAMHERELGLRLKQRLTNLEWVGDKSMWDYYCKYQRPFTTVLADMERTGVNVDRGYFEEKLKIAKRLVRDAAYTVVKELGWTPSKVETFLNSPVQLIEELYGKRSLPVLLVTDGGQCSYCGYRITKKMDVKRCPDHPYAELTQTPSTSDDALSRLMSRDALCRAILIYRKYDKKLKEIAELIDSIHPITGKIHTTFRQDVARTGRLSSTSPNLMNKTATEKEADIAKRFGMEVFDIRAGFIADAYAGNGWGAWDQSQLEYRVLAHFCRDRTLIDGFMNDEDFHSVTAKAVYKLDCAVKEVKEKYSALRSKAKNGNFCLNYGGGAKKLAFMSRISVEEAKEFIRLREQSLPGVYSWWDRQKRDVYERGYVSDILGWRCPVPDIYSDDPAIRGAAERRAINYPIQGSAAQIVKVSQLRLCAPTPEWESELSEAFKKTGWKLTIQVHDELDGEGPQDTFRQASDLVKYAFEHPFEYGLAVPLKADEGYGTSWSEAK